jgi:RHS repeat-associated protein
VYDVNGRRIEQLTPHGGQYGALQTHSWYDTDGHIRTSWDQNGQWMDDAFYLAGEYIGSYSTNFAFKDILGSIRILTLPDKSVRDSYDFLPFGEQEIGAYWSRFKFTGKVRDIESGLDNFGARYNSSQMGRFMSPDWSSAPMGVPYADFKDPRSLNLYSYVMNNPLRYNDRNGHCLWDGCIVEIVAAVVVLGGIAWNLHEISKKTNEGIEENRKANLLKQQSRDADYQYGDVEKAEDKDDEAATHTKKALSNAAEAGIIGAQTAGTTTGGDIGIGIGDAVGGVIVDRAVDAEKRQLEKLRQQREMEQKRRDKQKEELKRRKEQCQANGTAC